MRESKLIIIMQGGETDTNATTGITIIDNVRFFSSLAEPFPMFTWDPPVNRDSARKLAALRPELVCFGHGAPLYDADAFRIFVASLSD